MPERAAPPDASISWRSWRAPHIEKGNALGAEHPAFGRGRLAVCAIHQVTNWKSAPTIIFNTSNSQGLGSLDTLESFH